MNEATRLANLALEKRGYLVTRWSDNGPLPRPKPPCAWNRSLPMAGKVAGQVNGPFWMLCETDYADYCHMAEQIGQRPLPDAADAYFRVVAE